VHIYLSEGEKKPESLEYTIYGSISGIAMLSDLQVVHAIERATG
jgi:hypothetical protein